MHGTIGRTLTLCYLSVWFHLVASVIIFLPLGGNVDSLEQFLFVCKVIALVFLL